jgi:hypothetical protein
MVAAQAVIEVWLVEYLTYEHEALGYITVMEDRHCQ